MENGLIEKKQQNDLDFDAIQNYFLSQSKRRHYFFLIIVNLIKM